MRTAFAVLIGACVFSATAPAVQIPTEDRIVYEFVGAEVHQITGPPNPETYRGGLVHQESRNSVTYTLPNWQGDRYEVSWSWNDPPAVLEPRDPFGPAGPLQGLYEFPVQVSFTHGDNPGFFGPTLALTVSPCCAEGVVLGPESDPLTVDYWFNRFFLRDDWTLSVRVSDGNSFGGEVVTYRYRKRTVPAVPSTADCCEGRQGPGCAVDSCQSCVCGLQPRCCDSMWDDSCVTLANDECAQACSCPQPPPEDCCASTNARCDSQECSACGFESCQDCVCGIDSQCCSGIWHDGCASIARGRDCAAACLCEAEPPLDCCEAKLESGCGFEACEQCVCDDLAQCCDEFAVWDERCAERAVAACTDECLCSDARPPEDCCSGNLEVGCAFESCEACVCGGGGGHPECCSGMQVWDDTCADVAVESCSGACLCEPRDDLPRSCCEPIENLPCAFEECRSCVELVSPGCASGQWTAACAQAAIDECAESCFCEKTGTADCCVESRAPGCGDFACASCVCGQDDSCCGDRWSASCVAMAEGECAEKCRCDTVAPPECCAEHGGVGCAFAQCEDCVCNDLGLTSCCDGGWGTTCAIAARERCTAACLCDPGVREDCCGDSLNFAERGEAGCVTRDCELCVCSDPESERCCSSTWTRGCAEEARTRCAGFCGCEPPKGDCCDPVRERGDLRGCENEACALCVCAMPGFSDCCSEAWTEKCSLEAMTLDEDAPCLEVCGCVDLPEPVDCCSGVGGQSRPPGCSNQDCARCVCDDPDLFGCCSDEWGQECAGETSMVDGRCASLCCLGEPSDCCGNGERNPLVPGCAIDECARCICDDPDFFDCCTDEWSDKCIGAATTFAGRCADVCGCFEPQDCCRGGSSPAGGCATGACERCVCDDPEYFDCCTSKWTERCAIRAQSRQCAQSCGCAADSDCCHGPSRFDGTEAPYCFDRACETCVCGQAGMEECCRGVWTDQCAEVAGSIQCRRACQCRRSFRLVETADSAGSRIRVADAAAFPWFGVVQIGGERLRYFGIEVDEGGSGVLLVVERGYGDTTVENHADGAEVTLVSGVGTAGRGDASCDGAIDRIGDSEVLGLVKAVFTARTRPTCPFADANEDGTPSAADFPRLLLLLSVSS